MTQQTYHMDDSRRDSPKTTEETECQGSWKNLEFKINLFLDLEFSAP